MLSHLSRTTRATANGLLQSFENTVRAVAMFSSGLIITRYGYPRAFMVALVAYTLSALTFYLFFYRRSSLVGERDVTETA
jgi:sugar phosphate permease